jgi:hypothetical protein
MDTHARSIDDYQWTDERMHFFGADRDWVEVWNCLNDSVSRLGDSL